MVRGVTSRGRCGQGGRLLLLALFALAGCGSAEDGGGKPGLPAGWIGTGGQTGSLMPVCGLAPVARERGVPSSAAGIVVYTNACGALPRGELALFDAEGHPVPVQTQPLGDGVVLVTPQTGLSPGSYVLGRGTMTADAGGDAGFDSDADAGVGPIVVADAGAPRVQGEVLSVLAPSPPPARLGELHQVGGSCGTLLDLVLDPGIEPHLSSLALELRVGGSAPRRLVAFGTLEVTATGTARIAIPRDLLPADGPYLVTLEAVLAGDAVAIEPATLELECGTVAAESAAHEDSGCGVKRAGLQSPAGAAWLLAALAILRRRRRRRRPPD